MAVYNGRRYLREAVESVMHQTDLPHELLVVDDGSTDGSLEILDELTPSFPIRVFRQDHAGQSAARNHGIREAEGEFIAFLDQDDTWYPQHLELLCAPMSEDPGVGWVYSDFDEMDDESRTVTLSFLETRAIDHPKRSLDACLAADLMVLPSASVIRRATCEALGGFDERLRGYEDDDLYVRAFRSEWRLVFREDSLTRFRVHGSSSSANARFAESRIYFSQKLRATVPDDRRLNRYYMRDVVAPRFFTIFLDEYVRAVSDEDWPAARRALHGIRHFGDLRRASGSLRLKLLLLHNPKWFRRVLQVNDALPTSLKLTNNPAIRLR